jgi:DNA-binding beta-propeller fold protein YncE
VVAVLVAGTTMLAGCSSSSSSADDDLQVAPTLVAAAPAVSPVSDLTPQGTVYGVTGAITAIATDPSTQTLAVALQQPAELRLYSLADLHAAPKTVPLPGVVSDLTLAKASGPLLAPVPTADQVIEVTLPTATTTVVPVADGPTSATMVNGHLLVAQAAHKSLVLLNGDKVTKTISGDVTPQEVVTVGTKAVLLDRFRSAVFDVDPSGGTVGAGLRAGDGATNEVADNYGDVLVTDTRTGELLVFSADPVLMRQRFPVAGSPYGIAYDPKRDLAWVTCTKLNQVVGYDVAGGEPVEKYRFSTVRQPNSVAVDPDSGRVIVASADGGGIQVIQP